MHLASWGGSVDVDDGTRGPPRWERLAGTSDERLRPYTGLVEDFQLLI